MKRRVQNGLWRLGGFTLLEVIIALAILGVTLTGIFEISSQSIRAHVYAKKLTVATLLARSKMIDLEQELYDKGFSGDDDEQAGDFSDEGWPSFKWRAKIVAPRTNGLSPDQLIGAIFNLPMGGGGEGKEGKEADGLMGMMAGLMGGGQSGALGGALTGGQGGQQGAGGLAGMLGPMAGLAQQQFGQLVEQLQKSVREVHLTVTWKEGKLTESFDLVTHVVSLGPGSDRNGGAAAAQAAQTGQNPNQQTSRWVYPDGRVATNPQPGPNGQMMENGQPLMPYEQWMAAQGGNPLGGQVLPPANSRQFLPGGIGTLPGVRPVRPRGLE